MKLSPSQKDHLEKLLRESDELGAVRYLQNSLGMSAEEALALTEKLDKTVEEDHSATVRQMFKRSTGLQKDGKKASKWGAGIFLFFGLVMLGVAVYIFYSNYVFAEHAVAVEGVVVDYDTYYSTDDDGNSTLMYSAIFEYEYQGEVYSHVSEVSSSSPDHDEGEVVEMLIDPQAPHKAMANTFWERWFTLIIIGFFGIMFTGAGLMVWKVF